MYRLMRLVLTTTGLIFSFMAMTLHAAIMTFNVDVSGIDPPSGHNLRVFGTLTVDPVLPILASNTHSSLFFQHNVDTPIVLPSSPNFVTSTDALSWSLLNGDLYIDRQSNDNRYVSWVSQLGATGVEFTFSAGTSPHYLAYNHGFPVPRESFELKAAGGPDGPNGFLVGRGIAIPEPTSSLLVAVLIAMFSMRNRLRSEKRSRGKSS